MRPSQSAKSVSGNSENFVSFMRRLMKVPHSEIKAKLEAEKRTPKRRASPSSAVSSKRES
jgi:hypothetical protein